MPKRIELPSDIESLKRLVIEQRAALDAARVTLLSSQLEIEKLKIELAQLKRLRFGRSSEKLDERIAQLELMLEELEASEAQLTPLKTLPDPQAPIERSPAPARRPLPEHLTRETVTHQQECACPEPARRRRLGGSGVRARPVPGDPARAAEALLRPVLDDRAITGAEPSDR